MGGEAVPFYVAMPMLWLAGCIATVMRRESFTHPPYRYMGPLFLAAALLAFSASLVAALAAPTEQGGDCAGLVRTQGYGVAAVIVAASAIVPLAVAVRRRSGFESQIASIVLSAAVLLGVLLCLAILAGHNPTC
ncbi:MAG: hypothetical protein QOF68_788 [Gaiellales bacterium]|jgi:hypothetical protein|nr:hypothetical protein [Gaiellales bacterium]